MPDEAIVENPATTVTERPPWAEALDKITTAEGMNELSNQMALAKDQPAQAAEISPEDASRLERAIKSATSGEELQRAVSNVKETNAQPLPEEATAENMAALAAAGKKPTRLRIGGLSADRQDAIRALADPNTPPEEVARILKLSTAAPAAAPAPAQSPATTETSGIPGMPAADSPTPQQQPVVIPPAPTETVESIEAQIDALDEQRLAAMDSMDTVAAAAVERQIRALTKRLPEVKQAESEHQAGFVSVWNSSTARAAELFPDAFEEGSPLYNEIARLTGELERSGDPLVGHPNQPALVTAQAAANLGIAARGRTAPPAPTTRPTPVAAQTPRAVSEATPISPASGAARTAAPTHDAVARAGIAALDGIRDTGELSALLSSLK